MEMKNTKLDVCKKCWGTGHVHGGDDNSTWSKTCEECHGIGFIRVPMTNADRIRAMSDEELVKYFWDIGVWDSFEDGKFCDNNCNAEHNCDLCRLKWLQQPCEEDG